MARRVAVLLLALVPALTVLLHHGLSTVPELPAAAARHGTTGTAAMAGMPTLHRTSQLSVHSASGAGHHDPQHRNGHSCAPGGQLCAAKGVAHGYAPAAPGPALVVPAAAHGLLLQASAPANGPPPGPPDSTTVLRQ